MTFPAFVIGLSLGILIGLATYAIYGREHLRGTYRDQALEEVSDEMARLRAILIRSGLNIDDVHARLQEVEDTSGSWTGQSIPEDLRVPPGSIPRWDDPTRHKQ